MDKSRSLTVAGEHLPAERGKSVSRERRENFTPGKNGRLGGTGKTKRHVGEDVRDLESLRKRMPELERAYMKKKDAALAFKAVCDKAAELYHFEPSVIRVFIAASCDDTLQKKQKAAEQLQILFEEFAEAK